MDIYDSNGRETTYRYERRGLPGVYMVQPFSLTDNTTALRTMVSVCRLLSTFTTS